MEQRGVCFPFWQHLTADEQARVKPLLRVQHFAAGQTVRGPASPCLGILFVRTGALRMSLLSADGRLATIARTGAEEVCVLTASCVLSAITFEVEIDAVQDTEVLTMPSTALGPLLKNNPAVEAYVYRTATELFSDVIGAVERLLFLSLEQRIAAFLLDEAARQGTDTLHLTQEHLAQQIGSAREAVTRTLKQLSARGWVEVFRGGVRLVDRAALYALC